MTKLTFKENMDELKELIQKNMCCDATLENDYHITRTDLKATIKEKTSDVEKQFIAIMDLHHNNINLLEKEDLYGVYYYCDYVLIPHYENRIKELESLSYYQRIKKYGKENYNRLLDCYKDSKRHFEKLKKQSENLLTFGY